MFISSENSSVACMTSCRMATISAAAVKARRMSGVRRVWNTTATINVMPMPSRKPNARSSISEVNGESPVSTKFVSCRITSGIAKNIVTAISAAATPFATFIHRRARRTDASSFSSAETRLADVRRHRSTMPWERTITAISAISRITPRISVGRFTVDRRLRMAVPRSMAKTTAAARPMATPIARHRRLAGRLRPSPTVSSTLRLITSRHGPMVPESAWLNCPSMIILSFVFSQVRPVAASRPQRASGHHWWTV